MSAKPTAFVADDHPIIASLACRLLEDAGFEVTGITGDGVTALELITELGPTVAILDDEMPRMGGREIAARLRGRGSKTAIVLYTSSASAALVAEALRAGDIRCLVGKTAPVADLARAITAAAKGLSFVDPLLAGDILGRSSVLSTRECEVLSLVALGDDYARVGAKLGISAETVRTHIQHVIKKLGAHSRIQAVSIAIREGLIA